MFKVCSSLRPFIFDSSLFRTLYWHFEDFNAIFQNEKHEHWSTDSEHQYLPTRRQNVVVFCASTRQIQFWDRYEISSQFKNEQSFNAIWCWVRSYFICWQSETSWRQACVFKTLLESISNKIITYFSSWVTVYCFLTFPYRARSVNFLVLFTLCKTLMPSLKILYYFHFQSYPCWSSKSSYHLFGMQIMNQTCFSAPTKSIILESSWSKSY